jgi:YHS domain-containing protein
MSGKERQKAVVAVVTCLVLAVLVVQGCKKPEPETAPPPAAEPARDTAAKLETEAASAVAKATEQTTCPVMGGAINKDIFGEYKGRKVYFCCAGCKDAFEKDPEKYVAKLPQFKD